MRDSTNLKPSTRAMEAIIFDETVEATMASLSVMPGDSLSAPSVV